MSIEGTRATSTTETNAPAMQEPEEPKLTRGTWIGMIVVAIIIAAVVIFGLMARRGSERGSGE